jgi:hypothetical protein
MMVALSWAGNFAAVLGSVMLIVALFSETGHRKNPW